MQCHTGSAEPLKCLECLNCGARVRCGSAGCWMTCRTSWLLACLARLEGWIGWIIVKRETGKAVTLSISPLIRPVRATSCEDEGIVVINTAA